jgi:hypothetical protein
MEIVLALVAVVIVAALVYVNREAKNFDVNKDGKVDLDDVKSAVNNTVNAVKEVADVNNDGKVDAEDAKVVVEKAKTGAKKAATKAKTAVKKATSRGRKPKAQ